MILAYDLIKEDSDSSKKDNSSIIKKTPQDSLEFPKSKELIINNNIFVFDVKYAEPFSHDKKAQNDKLFFEKYEKMKQGDNCLISDLSINNDSGLSVKEDNFINTDVLKLLDSSSTKKDINSQSSLNISNLLEEEMNNLESNFKETKNTENLKLDFEKKLEQDMKVKNNQEGKLNPPDSSINSDSLQSSKKYIPKELSKSINQPNQFTHGGSNTDWNEKSSGISSPTKDTVQINFEYNNNCKNSNSNAKNSGETLNNFYINCYNSNNIINSQINWIDNSNFNNKNHNNIMSPIKQSSPLPNIYNQVHYDNISIEETLNKIQLFSNGDISNPKSNSMLKLSNSNSINNNENNNYNYKFEFPDNKAFKSSSQISNNIIFPNEFCNSEQITLSNRKYLTNGDYYSHYINRQKNFVDVNNLSNQMNFYNEEETDNIKRFKKIIDGANHFNQQNYHSYKLNEMNNEEDYQPHLKQQKHLKFFNNKINNYYKSSNYSELSNEDLARQASLIAREQSGCRFIQKKLEDDYSFAETTLYPAIFNEFLSLMIDPFGNYLLQKMLDYLSNSLIEDIIKRISPHIMNLGCNSHGTRVIQKIIDCINTEANLRLFIEKFNPVFIDLMKDINGNHIIIKFVSKIPYPNNQILYDQVIDNIVEITTHKHACCALQKCIDTATLDQLQMIISIIIENLYILIIDPYGNYVLQYIIMLDDFKTNYNIAKMFSRNISFFSKQKFSSNVIEKCFDHCNEETKLLIVIEISNPKLIVDLLLDMYGNYVLQKVLACAKEPYMTILMNSIAPYLEKLKSLNFGVKLYNRLILAYPYLNMFIINQNNINNVQHKNLKSKNVEEVYDNYTDFSQNNLYSNSNLKMNMPNRNNKNNWKINESNNNYNIPMNKRRNNLNSNVSVQNNYDRFNVTKKSCYFQKK